MAAGEESVATLDAVNKAVFHQKIQRSVDRDRRGTRHRTSQFFNDFIGSKRPMADQKRLEHPPADWGEFLPLISADAFGVGNRGLGALAVVVIGCGKD